MKLHINVSEISIISRTKTLKKETYVLLRKKSNVFLDSFQSFHAHFNPNVNEILLSITNLDELV